MKHLHRPNGHETLVELVRQHIADLLRFDSLVRVERKRKLIDLGLDSLMAVELRNRIAIDLKLEGPLSSTLVFDHPTLDSIADYLERDVLHLADPVEAASPEPDRIASRAEELNELAEEEVELLLLQKLQSL